MTITPSSSEQEQDFVAKLHGTWKSDWLLTKNHIDKECKLTAENIIGLERLMGKMTIRYEGTRAVFTMPEIRFIKEGKEHILEGWSFEETLNIQIQTDSQIALLTKSYMLHENEESINLITFENADTYWLYLGHSPLGDLHVREYFSRI